MPGIHDSWSLEWSLLEKPQLPQAIHFTCMNLAGGLVMIVPLDRVAVAGVVVGICCWRRVCSSIFPRRVIHSLLRAYLAMPPKGKKRKVILHDQSRGIGQEFVQLAVDDYLLQCSVFLSWLCGFCVVQLDEEVDGASTSKKSKAEVSGLSGCLSGGSIHPALNPGECGLATYSGQKVRRPGLGSVHQVADCRVLLQLFVVRYPTNCVGDRGLTCC